MNKDIVIDMHSFSFSRQNRKPCCFSIYHFIFPQNATKYLNIYLPPESYFMFILYKAFNFCPEGVPRKQAKRPWTEEERTVVHRHMGKFLALKRVPGKKECEICIEQESHVLNNRTWKEVKYFVHNEVRKSKKRLFKASTRDKK